MANYCFNSLQIRGSQSDIKKLQEFIRSNNPDESGNYDLDHVIPLETDSVDEAYKKWGTKWFTGIKFENRGKEAILSFDTAWSPPFPVTLEISKKFNLWIDHYYEEPGMWFEGNFIVDNGKIIEDEQREYTPYCADCGVKLKDNKKMVYDEEEYEYYCRKCYDMLKENEEIIK